MGLLEGTYDPADSIMEDERCNTTGCEKKAEFIGEDTKNKFLVNLCSPCALAFSDFMKTNNLPFVLRKKKGRID